MANNGNINRGIKNNPTFSEDQLKHLVGEDIKTRRTLDEIRRAQDAQVSPQKERAASKFDFGNVARHTREAFKKTGISAYETVNEPKRPTNDIEQLAGDQGITAKKHYYSDDVLVKFLNALIK